MIHYILDLGPSVLLPIIIIVLAIFLRVKLVKAIRSGIMIGTGFIGIKLIIGLMLNNLGPAAQDMAFRFGVQLKVIDIGWPGASPMTWASQVGSVAIPVAILVNITMLAFGWTRVVNVDIWNIWHMAFTGAILHIVTGSFLIGVIGVAIHAAFAYKLGDWFAPIVKDYFELDGITIPHGTTAYLAPIAVPVEWCISRIPRVRNINLNSENIENKLGVIGEPMIIGAVLGLIIGFLAGNTLKATFQLAIEMAAVMVLMPKVVRCIMEGLIPIADSARKLLERKFNGKEFYIGLDPALLLGDSQVIASSLIFVPLTVLISLIVPGNKVLPFGDLATIGFFIAMAVGIHKGNLFRTFVTGSITMFGTLWISTQMVPYQTILAENIQTFSEGTSQVASLDQGGSPITYILMGIFTGKNLIGLLIIGGIYTGCVISSIIVYKNDRKKLMQGTIENHELQLKQILK